MHPFLPITLFGIATLILLDAKRSRAEAPKPPPAVEPPVVDLVDLSIEKPPSALGKEVGGVVPGAVYRIVSIPKPDADGVIPVGAIGLRVVAYPRDPTLVGKLFRLQATIDAYGSGHPTVRQVSALL
jgi:hypothetical protein